MNKNGLIYDVEDKPRFGKLIVFALQQLLAIITATIAVPTIIGLPAQIPAAILGAGVGTIVYLLFTKFKSPVFLGSSFAFLDPLFVALAYGYCGILIGSIFAGLVYVVIAIVIHFAGSNWVSKLMPPVIIGPTVALIGLGLAGNAMGDIVTANSASFSNGSYNLVALLCGLTAFAVIIICSTQKKWKSMKLIPFIMGIAAGYALAAFFSIFGYCCHADYLKIIDWSPIADNFKHVKFTSFLDFPKFGLYEAIRELVHHNQTITGAGVGELAIAFIPVALVVFAEHIADHKNLSSIIGRDLVEGEPGLEKTLLGDGVGSIAGTIFGICPNTTYGESVGCVAITKNASVRTILVAACMCICISFLTPLMKVLQTIPSCVMGGVCLTLYGFIAVSGLKMFKNIDLGENKNLFTVSAILIAGIGGLAIEIPYALSREANGMLEVSKTITITKVATALLLGIAVYALMNFIEKRNAKLEVKEADDGVESLVAGAVAPEANFEIKGEPATEEASEKTEDKE